MQCGLSVVAYWLNYPRPLSIWSLCCFWLIKRNQRSTQSMNILPFGVSSFQGKFFAEGLNLIRLCDLCFYEPGTSHLFFPRRIFSRIDYFRPLLSPFFWYRTFYHWNSSVFWSMDPLLLTFWLVSATGLDILNSLWLKTIVKGLHSLLVTDKTAEPRLL